MPYNPEIHKRRSIRLKGYDYSQAGLYFITLCVQDRKCLFGIIENGEMVLNDAGKRVETEWMNLKYRFPHIELNEYVVMPNHFHGILEIVGATLVVAQRDTAQDDPNVPVGATLVVAQHHDTERKKGQPQGIAPTDKTIGDMMDAFKSITTVEYIRGVKNLGWQPFNGKLWQRNYYEHIIRDQQSYETIAHYIISNPAQWTEDKFYEK